MTTCQQEAYLALERRQWTPHPHARWKGRLGYLLQPGRPAVRRRRAHGEAKKHDPWPPRAGAEERRTVRCTLARCSPFPLQRATGKGGADGRVRLWRVDDGKLLKTYSGHGYNETDHTSSVLAVAFFPDGRHIASYGFDETVRIWPAEEVDLQEGVKT